VKEYKICTYPVNDFSYLKDICNFQTAVKLLLDGGWSLVGGVAIDRYGNYVQALVK
jgi:hypothetical protein